MYGYELDIENKKAWAGVAVLIVFCLGLFLLYSPSGESVPEQDTGNISYSSSTDDTISEVESKEPSKNFSIKSYGVDPYRRSIKLGEAVAFKNDRKDTVSLTFDRSDKEIEIKPGKITVFKVTGTTYLDIESTTGWTGEAQVYVE